MATATVLSAIFLQKQQVSFAPLSAPRPSFPRLVSPYCCQNGPLCSIPHHSSMLHIQGDVKAPRKTPSRRDAIALFLQVALLCAPNSNAQAAESGFERMECIERVLLRKELEVSSDVSPVLGLQSRLLMLAFQGTQKRSESSLGFLGCLVFGLLFLKEKQTRAAKDASLEDVQLRIKEVEMELCSQTRSSVTCKLEESQLGNGDRIGTSLDRALRRELVIAKSSVIERGKQLDMNKRVTESLRQQATGLQASLKVLEGDCTSLMGNVDKQLHFRHKLEAELQRIDLDFQCKAEEISSLKVAVADQEQVYKEMVKEHAVVESSLDGYDKKVLDAEKKVRSLESSLLATNGFAKSLAKQQNLAATRNETLDGKLDELLKSLQQERATSLKQLAEHNELLNLKGKEGDAWSAELIRGQNELEGNVRIVGLLTRERDELLKVVRERRTALDSTKEMLKSNGERLRIFEDELATLHEQLLHEQVQSTTLESNLRDNTVLQQLLKVSSELENQINTGKELTERLENELNFTREALSLSKVEILALQDSAQSILSSQAQLQDDLARLNEARQACSQALKKEKRAAAYAKKQLALCKEAISKESRVIEELQNELEEVRIVVEDSKKQITSLAIKLEKATESVSCLTDDVFPSKAALKEDPTLQMNLGGSDQILTSVGKPRRRRNISKKTTPKTRKNPREPSVCTSNGSLSSVSENGKAAAVDSHLGSSITG